MTTSPTLMHSPRQVIEIVGPAGVGKTTLVEALRNQPNLPELTTRLAIPPLTYLASWGITLGNLVPALIQTACSQPRFTVDDLRALAYLYSWLNVLRRPAACFGKIILFDHGPIYRLARLREFGPPPTCHPAYHQWWQSLLQHWMSALDVVIWLDAPDTTLIQRIEIRERWHAIKDHSSTAQLEFLSRYRAAYDYVLSAMASPHLRLLRFDTQAYTPQQIADQTLAALSA